MAEVVYRGYRALANVYAPHNGGGWLIVRVDDDVAQWVAHVALKASEMAWGSTDARSADLARSLLIDALGDRALCPICEGSGRIVRTVCGENFRAAKRGERGEFVSACPDCISTGFGDIVEAVFESFRDDVVARWPADEPWEIGRAEIVAYAEQRAAELGTRA